MTQTKLKSGKFDKLKEIEITAKKNRRKIKIVDLTTGKLDDIISHLDNAIKLLE